MHQQMTGMATFSGEMSDGGGAAGTAGGSHLRNMRLCGGTAMPAVVSRCDREPGSERVVRGAPAVQSFRARRQRILDSPVASNRLGRVGRQRGTEHIVAGFLPAWSQT